jgi:site-specific DNA recombinase
MSGNYGNSQQSDPQRVAIYARYSSDLQRQSSIEDQVRQCRDAAARNGWTVIDEFILSDKAVSGQQLAGRQGLDDLIKLAKQLPHRFDGIIIDDTSRFGRDLSSTLPMTDELKYANIFLYFANRQLDSRDRNF